MDGWKMKKIPFGARPSCEVLFAVSLREGLGFLFINHSNGNLTIPWIVTFITIKPPSFYCFSKGLHSTIPD